MFSKLLYRNGEHNEPETQKLHFLLHPLITSIKQHSEKFVFFVVTGEKVGKSSKLFTTFLFIVLGKSGCISTSNIFPKLSYLKSKVEGL